MKNKIKHIIPALLLLIASSSGAQVATSLYFMDNLPQSNILNPAFDPNYNFYFGLPIINSTHISFSSDIGLADVYNQESGRYFWNTKEGFNNFINELPTTSYLSTELNTSLFTLGFATGKSGYFHLSVNHRVDVTMGLPKDLFRMNDLTITHDFSGLEFHTRWFSEYAVGYSRGIGDKLVVGARFKYLAGMSNATLSFDQFDIITGEDAWGIEVHGSADIAGPIDIQTDADGVPQGADLTLNTSDMNELIGFALNFNNPGFGIDLGVEYQVIPRLKLSASIVDIGKINWAKEVTNLNIDGEYRFGGFTDLVSTNNEDGSFISFDDELVSGLADTVLNSVSLGKSYNGFSNTLSPKLFIAAEYELTPSLSVGTLYKTRFIRDEVRQNLYFNFNANFKRILTLGANYNYGFDSQNSYGGVLGLRLAAFYLYFAADVIPGYAAGGSHIAMGDGAPTEIPVSLPGNLSAANFQFGLNITLGERRRQMAKREKKAVQPVFEENIENSSLYYPF